MCDNRLVNGIHQTRYIASWINAGGEIRTGKDMDDFRDWLWSLGLADAQVHQIANMAMYGNRDLQDSAKAFISKHK